MFEFEPLNAAGESFSKWRSLGTIDFEKNLLKLPDLKNHTFDYDFETTIGYIMGRQGIYSGTLNEKGQPDGFGRFISKDRLYYGSIFECQFKEGEVDGFARLIWNDGSYRIGHFRDNNWVCYEAFTKDDNVYEMLILGNNT